MDCCSCFTSWFSKDTPTKTNAYTPLQPQRPKGDVNTFISLIGTHSQGSRSMSLSKSQTIIRDVNSQSGTQRNFTVAGLIKNYHSEEARQFKFQAEQNENGITIFLFDNDNRKNYIGKIDNLNFDDFRGL
jgi:hypothetical protein